MRVNKSLGVAKFYNCEDNTKDLVLILLKLSLRELTVFAYNYKYRYETLCNIIQHRDTTNIIMLIDITRQIFILPHRCLHIAYHHPQ